MHAAVLVTARKSVTCPTLISTSRHMDVCARPAAAARHNRASRRREVCTAIWISEAIWREAFTTRYRWPHQRPCRSRPGSRVSGHAPWRWRGAEDPDRATPTASCSDGFEPCAMVGCATSLRQTCRLCARISMPLTGGHVGPPPSHRPVLAASREDASSWRGAHRWLASLLCAAKHTAGRGSDGNGPLLAAVLAVVSRQTRGRGASDESTCRSIGLPHYVNHLKGLVSDADIATAERPTVSAIVAGSTSTRSSSACARTHSAPSVCIQVLPRIAAVSHGRGPPARRSSY